MMLLFHGGDLSLSQWLGIIIIFFLLPIAAIGIILMVFLGKDRR
jgi:hypothetical protein